MALAGKKLADGTSRQRTNRGEAKVGPSTDDLESVHVYGSIQNHLIDNRIVLRVQLPWRRYVLVPITCSLTEDRV